MFDIDFLHPGDDYPPDCLFLAGSPADVFAELFVHPPVHCAIIIRLLNDKSMYSKRFKGG